MTDDRADLTRIEDLGEFTHDVESSKKSQFADLPPVLEISEPFVLEEDVTAPPPPPDIPEELPATNSDEFPDIIFEPPTTDESLSTTEFAPELPIVEEIIPTIIEEEQPPILEMESTSENEDVLPPIINSEPFEEEITPPFQSENFQDIKEFAENLSYGNVATGGNPPYTLLISNIKYHEDKKDILIILKEHQLINESNEKDYEVSLEHGYLLLSQLPEYSAIYLAHKFRRFNLDIKFGLSEELAMTKAQNNNEFRGLINKETFLGRKEEDVSFNSEFTIDDILISTFSSLENRSVLKHVGIISTTKILNALDLTNDDTSNEELPSLITPLISDLKLKAYKLGSNGVLGISYQLIPLPGSEQNTQYKIICTGNAVKLSL